MNNKDPKNLINNISIKANLQEDIVEKVIKLFICEILQVGNDSNIKIGDWKIEKFCNNGILIEARYDDEGISKYLLDEFLKNNIIKRPQ